MEETAAITKTSQESRLYCLWWRRAGGSERFRNWVLANSAEDAVNRSRKEVSMALGANAGLWHIEVPRITRSSAEIATEVDWQSPAEPQSHWIRITASILILLCLFFLFHLKSGNTSPINYETGEVDTAALVSETQVESSPTSAPVQWLRSLLVRIKERVPSSFVPIGGGAAGSEDTQQGSERK